MEDNWKFHHVGVAIRDMDKAVAYYQSLGIATIGPEILFESSNLTDFEVNGKTPDTIVKRRIRFVQIGPIQLELVQPVEGESPQKEFLDSRGEGIDHIGFNVDDLDKEVDKLVKKGNKVILSGKSQTGGFAYFDTCEVGNVIIELRKR
ncbi:hypothetical protein ES705_44667 [subsurface metagenome]